MDNWAMKISETLAGIIEVVAVYTSKKEILIKGIAASGALIPRQTFEARLSAFGNLRDVQQFDSSVIIRLSTDREIKAASKLPWTNILLFAATVLSTLAAGAVWAGGPWNEDMNAILKQPLEFLAAGFPFSLSLLGILLFHEFGHYIAGRKHGVNVSLPYFIPAPIFSPFGTLGALIISKSPFINRKQLLDVGAAGPLAGLVVAIGVLFIGIAQSTIEPITTGGDTLLIGESLLMKFITYIVKGPLPETSGLYLSSVAMAGWVGILVTMFNLLPLGQLDGGKIIYALLGRRQQIVSKAVMIALVILSFYWTGWLVWLVIGIFLRSNHPPTILDEIPLDRKRIIVGLLSIAAFIICFVPVPVSVN